MLARGLGELCDRLGQPCRVGEIRVGILIGPTLLGRVAPELHTTLFPAEPVQLAMLESVGCATRRESTGMHPMVSQCDSCSC